MPLYSWGANSHGIVIVSNLMPLILSTSKIQKPTGQLGNSTTMDSLVPLLIANNELQYSQIAIGGGHVLMVSKGESRLFGCGWNNENQLLLGKAFESQTTINEIPVNVKAKITQVSAGWTHSLALTGILFFL